MRKLQKNLVLETLSKIFVLGTVVISLQACTEKIDARQTQTIQGLIYKLNVSDPYTGTLTNFEPKNFGLFVHGACDVGVKNGILDGIASCSLDNGVKFIEIPYVGGRQTGTMKQWNDSTKKLIAKIDFKDGVKDGVEEHFNPENEKMVASIHWTLNKKNGEEKIWDVSGENLLTKLVWKDDGIQNGYSKSGERENNYKDGDYHGSQKIYKWVGGNKVMVAVAVAEATAKQYGAGYFIPLVIKNPADFTFSEEIYIDGKLKQTETQPVAQAQTAETSSQQCLDLKIDAFRKENGPDAPIIDDIMREWNDVCAK